MITLKIDEIEIAVPEGMTVIDAAQQAGIYIPHLCSHPDLPSLKEMKPAEAVYRGENRIENKKTDLCTRAVSSAWSR